MRTTAIDTNIAIDLLNGKENTFLFYDEFNSLYLPVSNNSKQNLMKYRGFISNCIILNINSAIAEQYASIRKSLKDKATPIPENDIWIAATCIVYDIPLASYDKHFNNIEGLKLTE